LGFSSSQTKEKKRKTIEKEKKMQRKEGAYLLSSSHFALSLLVPTFGLLFLPFSFQVISPLHVLLLKQKKRKKHKEK